MGNALSEDSTPKQPLEERLKALINRHKVMAFIKGTRDGPRCGFTRTLIQILNGTGYVLGVWSVFKFSIPLV